MLIKLPGFNEDSPPIWINTALVSKLCIYYNGKDYDKKKTQIEGVEPRNTVVYMPLDEVAARVSNAMSNVDSPPSNCVNQKERVAELEEALRAIVKHQELVGGDIAKMSATRRIALKALEAWYK